MSSELVPADRGGVVTWSSDQLEVLKRDLGIRSDEHLAYFAQVATHKGLDPFLGEIVPVYYGNDMVIQETVEGLRTIAERSGLYGGFRGPFWCGPDMRWHEAWLDETTPPAVARYFVIRKDWTEPASGVARWASSVQLDRYGKPQALWKSRPDEMLGKTAEVRALKRAFPKEFARAGVNVRDLSEAQLATMEARRAGLDDDQRHALVAEITAGRTDSTREVNDDELLELRAEVARLRAGNPDPAPAAPVSVVSAGPHGTETTWYDPTTGERVDPTTDPTATGGLAVDAPGPDQRTVPAPVDGPTPPASTDAVPGPGPDEPGGYVGPNGRIQVPEVRPDVAGLRARFQALAPGEKEEVWAWLAKAKIPDSFDVSEAKVKAVNAELDRRAAAAKATA